VPQAFLNFIWPNRPRNKLLFLLNCRNAVNRIRIKNMFFIYAHVQPGVLQVLVSFDADGGNDVFLSNTRDMRGSSYDQKLRVHWSQKLRSKRSCFAQSATGAIGNAVAKMHNSRLQCGLSAILINLAPGMFDDKIVNCWVFHFKQPPVRRACPFATLPYQLVRIRQLQRRTWTDRAQHLSEFSLRADRCGLLSSD